jgi:hypothetical protein
MLNAQRNDHCIAFRVLPFVSATQRMTKTRVNALTTMYERKLLAQKLKGKKNCISFHGSESYPIQISELKHKGVVWTSNTPGEHQVRRHIVMAKDISQLASVAMLPPRLLMLTGRI